MSNERRDSAERSGGESADDNGADEVQRDDVVVHSEAIEAQKDHMKTHVIVCAGIALTVALAAVGVLVAWLLTVRPQMDAIEEAVIDGLDAFDSSANPALQLATSQVAALQAKYTAAQTAIQAIAQTVQQNANTVAEAVETAGTITINGPGQTEVELNNTDPAGRATFSASATQLTIQDGPTPILQFNAKGRDKNGVPLPGIQTLVPGLYIDAYAYAATSCPEIVMYSAVKGNNGGWGSNILGKALNDSAPAAIPWGASGSADATAVNAPPFLANLNLQTPMFAPTA